MGSNSPLEGSFGKYIWCELCGHVYSAAAWGAADDTCPNCGASIANARPWEEIRQRNPQYPVTPIEGKEYALYG
jgi:rubredoxin